MMHGEKPTHIRRLTITVEAPIGVNDNPDLIARAIVIGWSTHAIQNGLPYAVIDPSTATGAWAGKPRPDSRTLRERVVEVKEGTSRLIQDELEKEIRR